MQIARKEITLVGTEDTGELVFRVTVQVFRRTQSKAHANEARELETHLLHGIDAALDSDYPGISVARLQQG